MKIADVIKNGAALGAGVLLSCGASQLFGVYRLTADLYTTCKVNKKIKSLALFEARLSQKEPIKLTQSEIKKISNRSKVMQQKFAAQPKTGEGSICLTRAQADSLIKDVKAIIQRNKTKKVVRLMPSLKADLFCFLPLIGAFAWRVRYQDWKTSASQGVSHGLGYALERHGKRFRRFLFPLNNGRTLSAREQRLQKDEVNYISHSLSSLNYSTKEIEIEVNSPGATTRKIQAYSVKSNEEGDRPTVVIFHGNGDVAAGMLRHAFSYAKMGYNILMPTLGGYPNSGKIKTSEESLMRDVFAIQTFLKEQGVKEVVCHGISLGGASAVLFGATSPLPVKAVIADQTFTRSSAAAGRFANNISCGLLGGIGEGLFKAAFPSGKLVHLKDGSTAATNGLDNLSRISLLKDKAIALVTISSKNDFIMRRKNENFSDELYLQRYPNKDGGLHIYLKNGSHADNVFSCEEGGQLEKYLKINK